MLTYEGEEEEGEFNEREVREEVEVEAATPSEVSLNSVIGLTNPKTMKILGEIHGVSVVVMVDPGATHNFVSLEAVAKLGIR